MSENASFQQSPSVGALHSCADECSYANLLDSQRLNEYFQKQKHGQILLDGIVSIAHFFLLSHPAETGRGETRHSCIQTGGIGGTLAIEETIAAWLTSDCCRSPRTAPSPLARVLDLCFAFGSVFSDDQLLDGGRTGADLFIVAVGSQPKNAVHFD